MTMTEGYLSPRRTKDGWEWTMPDGGVVHMSEDAMKGIVPETFLRHIPLAPVTLPSTPNVISALAAVMAEMPGIGKDDDSTQGYKYRGIEAITAHAQRLLGKHGVVFVPKVISRKVVELSINNRPWTQDELEVVYTVYGPGGVTDCIEVGPIYGLGRDNSDKGASKAMTMAYKYALLQSLCIGDAKDDGDREEAHQADPPGLTADELAQRDGWAGVVEHDEERATVRPRLKALDEARVIDHERAGALWSEYQRPDGGDRPARPRTRSEHTAFVAALPTSPPHASGPQPPTHPATTPPEAAEVPQESTGAEPAPNGYRDELDELCGADIDGLIERLKRMPGEDIIDALAPRDRDWRPPADVTPDQLRQRLSGLILKAWTADQAAAKASAAPGGGKRAAKAST